MNAADIRQQFLDYFAARGHSIIPSSPLVPVNDPTLMFTNSGMVQFKDVFLGVEKRPYVRAASCQACLRAGGKHNDLENVGYTARHHTFFEMLGNWSFGDYFKRESLLWGWELLTSVYGLAPEKLWATVYEEDDEAYAIWKNDIGMPKQRIVRIGDNKGARYASDNFWMMADTGPCGPSSEIFYDHGTSLAGGPPGSDEAEGDRFVEIWNHVFMQFNIQADGSMHKLPMPCVDTGMGLERLAAILQGEHSNYDIDIFKRLIASAARATNSTDLASPSLKVIADHIRSCAFLITDGIMPGNEGRPYVLRRIVRRAIRHGYKLGAREPFFHSLTTDLAAEMGEAYPNLLQQASRIAECLQQEEERFFVTIEHGMEILEESLKSGGEVFSGATAFKLHDTYGFPLDLTQDVCREHDVSVDVDAFNVAMARQKEQARAGGKFKMATTLEYSGKETDFRGYETLEHDCKVLALYRRGEPVTELKADETGSVVLDQTPFYAESGGQVGDRGLLQSESGQSCFEVEDTQKIHPQVFAHHGTVLGTSLRVNDLLHACVDQQARLRTMRHHSATHLMHKALRKVLGEHVMQKGSQVDQEKTRFDFTHNSPLSPAEIRQIEALVNTEVLHNAATQARLMPLEEAKKTGAMMLFGEKYGDEVRVLDIGSTCELCAGTHVARTGDIGLFKIVAQAAVASGIRRVEAVCGDLSLTWMEKRDAALNEAAEALNTSVIQLPGRVKMAFEQNKKLERELAHLKQRLASAQGNGWLSRAVTVEGVQVLATQMDGSDAKTLRSLLDQLKDKLPSAVIVIGSASEDGKVNLIAGISKNLTAKLSAGELVNAVAQQVGGKGGGRADMAQAGGSRPEQLPAALASVKDWVAQRL